MLPSIPRRGRRLRPRWLRGDAGLFAAYIVAIGLILVGSSVDGTGARVNVHTFGPMEFSTAYWFVVGPIWAAAAACVLLTIGVVSATRDATSRRPWPPFRTLVFAGLLAGLYFYVWSLAAMRAPLD